MYENSVDIERNRIVMFILTGNVSYLLNFIFQSFYTHVDVFVRFIDQLLKVILRNIL